MRYDNPNAELRAEGREIHGILMRYGDTGRVQEAMRHRAGRARLERFLPGSLTPRGSVTLNLRHAALATVAWHPGGGLELNHEEDMVQFRATAPPTPAGELALSELRAGRLGGASVEFYPTSERMDGDTRIIAAAEYDGIALTSNPIFEGSTVELRQSGGIGVVAGRIPKEKSVSCGCHKGRCRKVRFASDAFKEALRSHEEMLAVSGEYVRALGSRKRGTLVLDDRASELRWAAAIPNTTSGRDLVELADAVPLLGRPIFDQAASTYHETGDVAVYSSVAMRSVLIGASDADTGWEPVRIRPGALAAGVVLADILADVFQELFGDAEEEEVEERSSTIVPPSRNRRRLWL